MIIKSESEIHNLLKCDISHIKLSKSERERERERDKLINYSRFACPLPHT
jgi:predicted metal-dependent peptidase